MYDHLRRKAARPAALSVIDNVSVIGPNQNAIAPPTPLVKSAVMNAVSIGRKNIEVTPFCQFQFS